MAQEQKQKLVERIAEKAMSVKNVTYAVVLQAVHEALNARDEEVEQLKDENTTLLNQCEEQRGFIAHLKAELAKAQNPWIIAEEDGMPEIKEGGWSDPVLLQVDGQFLKVSRYCRRKDGTTYWNGVEDWNGEEVDAWMPIPEGGKV